MDYDALKLFLHLSESLHFGRTSRACHVSPSALSRLVQRLERDVGCALLERDPRTVKLTPEGARFAAHARDTLGRWDDLRRKIHGGGQTLAGTLSVFASVTACQTFLPRTLSAFRAAHPDIHIRLDTGHAADAIEMVRKGAVDVAVAALPDRAPASLQTRVLLHTPLVFVAPAAPCEVARLCERTPLPWAALPIVLPATGLARASADRWFRKKRVSPLRYGEVAGNEAILSLVSLGCGVGIVPKLVMDKSPLRAEVRALAVEPRLGEIHVGVCTLRRRMSSPIVKAFWDTVQAAPREAL